MPKRQLLVLMLTGFFLACGLKLMEIMGLISPFFNYIAVYLIYFPLIVIDLTTDSILSKMGYHPSFFGPDDVPADLESLVFLSLIIALFLGLYLIHRTLKILYQWKSTKC
jgi:hypothetical protein